MATRSIATISFSGCVDRKKVGGRVFQSLLNIAPIGAHFFFFSIYHFFTLSSSIWLRSSLSFFLGYWFIFLFFPVFRSVCVCVLELIVIKWSLETLFSISRSFLNLHYITVYRHPVHYSNALISRPIYVSEVLHIAHLKRVFLKIGTAFLCMHCMLTTSHSGTHKHTHTR